MKDLTPKDLDEMHLEGEYREAAHDLVRKHWTGHEARIPTRVIIDTLRGYSQHAGHVIWIFKNTFQKNFYVREEGSDVGKGTILITPYARDER